VFADLIATPGVEEIHLGGAPVGVMAIHGGIEEGTDSIAHAVTEATGASLYTVAQPQTLRWHVPSIRFDPAHSKRLRRFLNSVDTTISLHGYGEPGLEATALLGGNNRALAWAIHGELAARGIAAIADLDGIPPRLRGIHRLNPVNRPPLAGAQVELPMELREGRPMHAVIEALAVAVANAMVHLSGESTTG
jgi:phage replication-related protein YjqB (UPF0714/DUF867 family)